MTNRRTSKGTKAIIESQPTVVLVTLKQSYDQGKNAMNVQKLSAITGITYYWVWEIIAKLTQEGLVKKKREGVSRRIKLTDLGKEISGHLQKISNKVS